MGTDFLLLIGICLVIVASGVILIVFVIRDQRLRDVVDTLIEDFEAEGDAVEKRLIVTADGVWTETEYEDGDVVRVPMLGGDERCEIIRSGSGS